jgi:hypothetical protein
VYLARKVKYFICNLRQMEVGKAKNLYHFVNEFPDEANRRIGDFGLCSQRS